MIDPKTVTAGGVTVLAVIRNTGEGGFSVARVRKEGQESLAIRWNGSGDEKGYPTARGYPVWFMLPKEAGLTLGTFYQAKAVADAADIPLGLLEDDLRVVG